MIPWVNEKALSLSIEDGKKENQIEVFQKEKNNQKNSVQFPGAPLALKATHLQQRQKQQQQQQLLAKTSSLSVQLSLTR